MALLATKKYIDMMVSGMNWHGAQPQKPITGDCYFDTNSQQGYIFNGNSWILLSPGQDPPPKAFAPTEEQLEKHPSLKAAWEEFLVIKRLLGV